MLTSRTRIVCGLSLFWLLSVESGKYVIAQSNRDPETWVWNDPRETYVKGVQHKSLESDSMARTVGYCIYLPPQYEQEPSRRFPVIYFLHGSGGTESSDAGFAGSFHGLISKQMIDPYIVVFPNGGRSSGYRDWPDRNVKSETHLIKELLPTIDREYRTESERPRGICGFSMGGNGAIRLTLKYPELFRAAAALAAGFPDESQKDESDNVYSLAAGLSQEHRSRYRFWLAIGDEDSLFPKQAPAVKHFRDLGIKTTLNIHSHVGHDLGMLTRLSGIPMILNLDRELKDAIQPKAAE